MASDPTQLIKELRRAPSGPFSLTGKAADMLEALAAERDAALKAKYDAEMSEISMTGQWQQATDAAFKAGAEAMREACARTLKFMWADSAISEQADAFSFAQKKIRALPVPTREGGDV